MGLSTEQAGVHYELRFECLFHSGRAFVFPCDRDGRVDMDALSHAARTNYLYARVAVGREFAEPEVLPCCVESINA